MASLDQSAPVCVQGLKRGLRLIDAAMAELKGTPAEGQVSMADMIALAGAYAVSKTGGPKIEVPVGECFTRFCRRIEWAAPTRPSDQILTTYENGIWQRLGQPSGCASWLRTPGLVLLRGKSARAALLAAGRRVNEPTVPAGARCLQCASIAKGSSKGTESCLHAAYRAPGCSCRRPRRPPAGRDVYSCAAGGVLQAQGLLCSGVCRPLRRSHGETRVKLNKGRPCMPRNRALTC